MAANHSSLSLEWGKGVLLEVREKGSVVAVTEVCKPKGAVSFVKTVQQSYVILFFFGFEWMQSLHQSVNNANNMFPYMWMMWRLFEVD